MMGKFCDLSNHITTKHKYILKYNNHNTKGKNRKWKSTKCGHSDPWKYERIVVRSIKTKKKHLFDFNFLKCRINHINIITTIKKQWTKNSKNTSRIIIIIIFRICAWHLLSWNQSECEDNLIKSRKRFGKCIPL